MRSPALEDAGTVGALPPSSRSSRSCSRSTVEGAPVRGQAAARFLGLEEPPHPRVTDAQNDDRETTNERRVELRNNEEPGQQEERCPVPSGAVDAMRLEGMSDAAEERHQRCIEPRHVRPNALEKPAPSSEDAADGDQPP